MDALLVATRLPALAERTVRRAILSSLANRTLTPRSVIDASLLHFERAISRVAADGIRPSLLFAERDRIVRDLKRFLDSRLAIRLAALHPRNVLSRGRAARPFDAIVRGRDGRSYALVVRTLGDANRRLRLLRDVRNALAAMPNAPDGVLVYDAATAQLALVRERAMIVRKVA